VTTVGEPLDAEITFPFGSVIVVDEPKDITVPPAVTTVLVVPLEYAFIV
jgi:hypothetical protein